MDQSYYQCWANAVENVAAAEENPDKRNTIQLLGQQVSIDVDDQNQQIIFICNNDYVYKIFLTYVSQFYIELKHSLKKEEYGIDIRRQNPNAGQTQPVAPKAANVSESFPNTSMPNSGMNGQGMQQGMMSGFQLPYGYMQQPGMMPGVQYPYGYAQAPQSIASDINTPAQTAPEVIPLFLQKDSINPNKTFDNYVTDPENKLIVSIAEKVAARPGDTATNPLYIYGGSGLGKTHLLFAIANRIRATQPNVKVCYMRAESFIRYYVDSMSKKNQQQIHFQDYFSTQNVFIVDDIQNFVKAKAARDTFFEIVAEFYMEDTGRQLVLASDTPPGGLESFSPRLISRFGSGVCREVYPPNSETRKAITMNKCREFHVNLSEDIIDYISTHIRSNVREIEGAIKSLNQVISQHGTITYEEAVKNLAALVNVKAQFVTIDAVKERVASEFDVTVESMESAERKKPVTNARSMAMKLAHDLIPSLSLNDIGRSFNKDHSSVHEAIKRTQKNIDENVELRAVYENLRLSLKK